MIAVMGMEVSGSPELIWLDAGTAAATAAIWEYLSP